MAQSETRDCRNCKAQFTIEPEDFGFYEKVQVPPPTWCPECRLIRRLTWRNDRSLYTRTCGLCQNRIVTLYSEESGVIPYCNKCFWSDKWDQKSYGRDYDFSRPFFEQLKELELAVPHQATMNDDGIASVNCEYSNDCWYAKNCYMAFYMWHAENVMYSCYITNNGKNLVDCLNILTTNEWLYECHACDRSYNLKYCDQCVSCNDSAFLFDCRSSSDCFLCAGLRNKKYCFKNEQYSKEEYEKILAGYRLDTRAGVERARKEYDEFILNTPRRYALMYHSVNCAGDLLYNGKNSSWCFTMQAPVDSKWIDAGDKANDVYDASTTGEVSRCYEMITCDQSDMNHFGLFSVKSQDLRYTQYCTDSKHLFGCIGLRKAQYCILNKQYTKEEYEALLPKIIEHMDAMPYVDKRGAPHGYGDFFPSDLSPFGYNETVAQERYPLAREEALAKNWKWQDNVQRTSGKETLKPDAIPAAIADVEDSILNEVLKCVECERNYKIFIDELNFYRRMGVPVPVKCFFCRHNTRVARRNPYYLWERQCDCAIAAHGHAGRCPERFQSSYKPGRPEKVYCEKCYQAEIS